ncbi:MAG: hypothetical protein KDD47_19535, partial [Acidobacteria bacterium]|nr:hypothetical protein [Acidobacteriota bacterium]
MHRDRLLLLAFLLSGSASLGYEILWTRLLSIALGSETLGVLAVLSGFFGGMALGSWWLHGAVRRSPRPVRLFALLEGTAALFALVSPPWLSWLAQRLPPLLGPFAGDNDTPLALLLALAASALALLPGTFCLGGTFAALVEARRRAFREDSEGRGLGRLYAANTLGATLGILGTVFLLMPRTGLAGSALLLGLVGLAAAVLGLVWQARVGTEGRPEAAGTGWLISTESPQGPRSRSGILALLCLTGLAGIGLEVVVVQVLRQLLENTVYTFAALLSVYLVGTAAGAALYSRWARRLEAAGRARTTTFLLLLQVLTTLLCGWLLAAVPWTLWLLGSAEAWAGDSVAAEFLAAALAFTLPTVGMGALFSHLMAQMAPQGVGRAYALNTVGGTLAPFIFGAGLLHTLGYRSALGLVALLYLVLCLVTARRLRIPALVRWGTAGGLVLVSCWGLPSLVLVRPPEGWKEIYRAETLHGLVLVSEQVGGAEGAAPLRRLQVDRARCSAEETSPSPSAGWGISLCFSSLEPAPLSSSGSGPAPLWERCGTSPSSMWTPWSWCR